MDENILKKNVVGLLKTISDRQKQLDYQQGVPVVNVATELVCQWFDDLYHPGSALHVSAFTKKESKRLATFNRYFKERTDSLPHSIEELHSSNVWEEIENEAQNVLADLGWDQS